MQNAMGLRRPHIRYYCTENMSCNLRESRHVADTVYPASKDINGTVCDNDLSTSTQSLDKQMQTDQAHGLTRIRTTSDYRVCRPFIIIIILCLCLLARNDSVWPLVSLQNISTRQQRPKRKFACLHSTETISYLHSHAHQWKIGIRVSVSTVLSMRIWRLSTSRQLQYTVHYKY